MSHNIFVVETKNTTAIHRSSSPYPVRPLEINPRYVCSMHVLPHRILSQKDINIHKKRNQIKYILYEAGK